MAFVNPQNPGMTKYTRLIPWILIAALAMFLIGSTFYKALTSSFTHDESFTWNHYVTASLADIFSYKVVSPNNHLLNTLLMKTGAFFFGTSEIVLRFPNILAHLGFIIFSLLLFRKLDPWIILPLFALVNCNPYLLDFFALARGNGLSYFFLMGSICFTTRFIEFHKTGYYLWAVLLAFFGVLSHFSLLYYFLSLIVVANLWPFLKWFITRESGAIKKVKFVRINLVNLFFLSILVIIMVGPIRKLIIAGQFYYGGENGFWHDTIGTLIETFFYGNNYHGSWIILMQILIVSAVISISGLFLTVLFRKDRQLFAENSLLFLVFCLLLASVFINISQFYLTGTKLLIRRYGLFYYPMFMLCLGYLLVAFIRHTKVKILPGLLMYTLALAFTIHTLSAFSTTTYLDWDYEKETKNVMTLLEKDMPVNAPAKTTTVGISWLFEPTINFYRHTRGLTWLKEVTRDGPAIRADYYYIFRDDLTKLPLHGHLPVILFDDGRTILVKI